MVSGAGSGGRRNTIHCFDSRMLPRQDPSVWPYSIKTKAGQRSLDLALASGFSLCFPANWVPVECCVNPVRPPDNQGVGD
jgi:hypothetical protein